MAATIAAVSPASPTQFGWLRVPSLRRLGAVAGLGFELDPYSILVPFLVFAIGVSHGAQKMNGIMHDIARGAQPNTTLADATISMGGYPAALRDTRDYYQQDIRFIIAVTLVIAGKADR
jgi:hypothetical protein